MTKTAKFVALCILIAICALLYIVIWKPFAAKVSSDYTIQDGHVSGKLEGNFFSLILDAEIDADEQAELNTVEGGKIDYMGHRTEILENIFGSIEDLTGIVSEGVEHPIANLRDLEEYVSIRQEMGTNPENTGYAIIPEDHAFSERYNGDGIELVIAHREDIVQLILPIPQDTSPQHQAAKLRELAQALSVEEYFNFDDFFPTEDGIVVPARVNGLPVVSYTRDFLLDKHEELYVLMYKGYNANPMGFSSQLFSGSFFLWSQQTILPLETSSKKQPVISVQEAIEALSDKLDTVYIDGQIPPKDPNRDDLFIISKIQLAYAAIHVGEDKYTLRPVYVFVNTGELEWDYCFHVDAHSGEIYPVISGYYSGSELNPQK